MAVLHFFWISIKLAIIFDFVNILKTFLLQKFLAVIFENHFKLVFNVKL